MRRKLEPPGGRNEVKPLPIRLVRRGAMNDSMQRIAGLGLGFLVIAALSGVQGRAEAAEVRRVSERLVPFAAGGQTRIADKNGRISVAAWHRNDVRVQRTRSVRAE